MATPQPKNRAPFSIADALAATGGRLPHASSDSDIACVGVAIDSRAIEAGNLFVAIAGERFDGHDHARAAALAGARILIVSRDVGDVGDAAVILVPDTTKALGALARFHRRRWSYAGMDDRRRRVIGITGSAGKTTTRHATAAVLEALGYKVHSSAGNLNNAIGVPLTVLGLTDEHEALVVEIGTNARGEIAHGAWIAEPDVGVLTLVAEAHTQGIGSIWDVAEEKGALFLGLRRWGTAIANGDDSRARAQLPRSPARRYLTYGTGSHTDSRVDVRLLDRTPEGARGIRLRLEVKGSRVEAFVPLLGKAGAYAALASVAVAVALEPTVSPEALARALSAIGPTEPGRLAPIELADGTILIDDAYNANPASMIASIGAASEIARSLGRRLVLVLGEMFELGGESGSLHAKVGEVARAASSAIVAVSGAARAFVDPMPSEGIFVANVREAQDAVRTKARPGDVILVKASHSVGLGAISVAMQSTAVQSETLRSETTQSETPQSGTTPTKATPSKATPSKATPSKATPTKATPSKATQFTAEPRMLASESEDAFRARLRGAQVVVVGLGASGIAAARLAKRLGAKVVATDSAPEEKLSEKARALASEGIRIAAGGHGDAGLDAADLIVISPGVPPFPELVTASLRRVPVIAELELATRLLSRLPSVSITGSNGKSTTTLLVGELLAAKGMRPFVGGNLGDPPSDIVPSSLGPIGKDRDGVPFDALVLEVSSYQAERMPTFHPRAAALLNVSPNHLDRYDTFDAYVHAKGNLFVNQTENDVAVIPSDDPRCAREAGRGHGRALRFGPASDAKAELVFTKTEIVDRVRQMAFPRASIRLAGDHNALNLCAALGLVAPFELAASLVAEVFDRFAGLPHRIAFVREAQGVRYYDDSKGTNVGATVAAIRGLGEHKIVLVAGGRDKLGSYDPLVLALRERGRAAVLIGEAADRIADAIGTTVPVARASSMSEAVTLARSLAEPGDAVLLSPACSSFDMFRDYKHRGDAFVEAVTGL